MKLYSIKKQIRAKNPMEALQKEKQAEITDVWTEEEEKKEARVGASVIGFAYDD